MASHRTPVLFLLVALVAASGCTASDQIPSSSPRGEQRGDCGPGRRELVSVARGLMDERVPSGRAVFRGAADVCGIDEFEIAVGREPPLEEGRSTRASASVFFTPTILFGEPGQELTLVITHDGRTKTHSFTVDELDIDELLFSSDGRGLGTRTSVDIRIPMDESPLLFYCRFHRVGGMWGALVPRYSRAE
jgi:hypothetical protein